MGVGFSDHKALPPRDAAMKCIRDDIDNHVYNLERRQSHLDCLNRIEFELRSQINQNMA